MNYLQARVLSKLIDTRSRMDKLFTNDFDNMNDTARRSLSKAISEVTNAIGYQRGT